MESAVRKLKIEFLTALLYAFLGVKTALEVLKHSFQGVI
jgi:hypothetical protein